MKHCPQLSGKVYCGESASCTIHFEQSLPESATGCGGHTAVSQVRLTEHNAYCTIHIQSSSSEKLFKWREKYCGTGQTSCCVFKNWKVIGDCTVPVSGVKPDAAISHGGLSEPASTWALAQRVTVYRSQQAPKIFCIHQGPVKKEGVGSRHPDSSPMVPDRVWGAAAPPAGCVEPGAGWLV